MSIRCCEQSLRTEAYGIRQGDCRCVDRIFPHGQLSREGRTSHAAKAEQWLNARYRLLFRRVTRPSIEASMRETTDVKVNDDASRLIMFQVGDTSHQSIQVVRSIHC